MKNTTLIFLLLFSFSCSKKENYTNSKYENAINIISSFYGGTVSISKVISIGSDVDQNLIEVSIKNSDIVKGYSNKNLVTSNIAYLFYNNSNTKYDEIKVLLLDYPDFKNRTYKQQDLHLMKKSSNLFRNTVSLLKDNDVKSLTTFIDNSGEQYIKSELISKILSFEKSTTNIEEGRILGFELSKDLCCLNVYGILIRKNEQKNKIKVKIDLSKNKIKSINYRW